MKQVTNGATCVDGLNTLTGHFNKYTLLMPGWTPFSFRTDLSLHGKVLETFLRDISPYCMTEYWGHIKKKMLVFILRIKLK